MNDTGKKLAGGTAAVLIVAGIGWSLWSGPDGIEMRHDPPPVSSTTTTEPVAEPPAPEIVPPRATERRIEAAGVPEPPAKRIDTVDPLPPAPKVYVYTLTRPDGLVGLATVCLSFTSGPDACVDFEPGQNKAQIKDTRAGAMQRWAPRWASEPFSIEITATTTGGTTP